MVTIGSSVRIADLGDIKTDGSVKFLSKTDFELKYAHRKLVLGGDGEAEVKRFDLSRMWLEHEHRRTYDRVTFCPKCSDDQTDGALNLFVGFGVEPKQGDWRPLRAHLLDNVCNGNRSHFVWLLAWMAQLVSVPDEKKGTAVVLRGKKGTGKSKIGQWLMHIIGPAHSQRVTQASHVTGKFNAHLATNLLLVCEEAVWAGDKQALGTMKSLITDETVMMERKGVDAVEVPNFTRLLITSNEDWVVPATDGERRFFVLDVGDARMQDTEYFRAIDGQMKNGGAEAMLYDLLQFPFDLPYVAEDFGEDFKRISIDLRNPPKTEGLAKQIIAGLGDVERWLRSSLIDGGFTAHGVANIYADGMGDAFLSFRTAETTKIPKEVVRASAAKARASNHSASMDVASMTDKLKGILPALGTGAKSPMIGGKRPPAYEFPPLTEMRKAWTAKYHEAPWSIPGAGDQGEANSSDRTDDLLSIVINDFWILRDEAKVEGERAAAMIDGRTPIEKARSDAAITYSATEYHVRVAEEAAAVADKKSVAAARAALQAGSKRAAADAERHRHEAARVRLEELDAVGTG